VTTADGVTRCLRIPFRSGVDSGVRPLCSKNHMNASQRKLVSRGKRARHPLTCRPWPCLLAPRGLWGAPVTGPPRRPVGRREANGTVLGTRSTSFAARRVSTQGKVSRKLAFRPDPEYMLPRARHREACFKTWHSKTFGFAMTLGLALSYLLRCASPRSGREAGGGLHVGLPHEPPPGPPPHFGAVPPEANR